MLEKGLNSPAFHAGIHGFESRTCHSLPGRLAQLGERLPYKQNVGGSIPSTPTFLYGAVVQMVRMPACHAGGRGFDSHLRRIFLSLDSSVGRAED